MLELGPVAADIPDFLRLIAVPTFLWAAYQDLRTRRVKSWLWPPVLLIGLLALLIEGSEAFATGGIVWREFIVMVGFSLGILLPIAAGFTYFNLLGMADIKAIVVLALLFPTVPHFEVGTWTLPVIDTASTVFSLAILANAVMLGFTYPVALGLYNLLSGDVSKVMWFGHRIDTSQTTHRHGSLLESTDEFVLFNGLDLDALRMYLTWRDCTLEDIRSDPERHRETIPETPIAPGDGAIADGGTNRDPWGAQAFLDDIPGDAYGTTPQQLRDGLELLVERDQVWYSPGMPFLVLIAAGIILAFIVGDLLGAVMLALDLV